MKFGLFFEQPVTMGATPEQERRVFLQNIEQAVLAEQLGFDQAWVVEHYFLEGYSNSASPETFLAYLAARTTTLRLGHGVRILNPKVTHPVRAAMMAAYLDVISGGRVEFGTGRQSTWNEMGAFGVDPDESREVWEELIRAVPKMWTEDEFSWDGEHLKFPPRPVRPKPMQDPHPPLWVAAMSPETAEIAGRHGLGFLGTSLGAPDKYASLIATYREAVNQCEQPAGAFINNQANGVCFMYCGESDEAAAREGLPSAQAFFGAASSVLGVGAVYPSPGYQPTANAAGSGPINRPGQPIGSPETCIEVIKRWEEAGLDRLCFLVQFDQVTPQEQILASLERFAREVMPEFEQDSPALAGAGKPV